jgi:hypothetical protein
LRKQDGNNGKGQEGRKLLTEKKKPPEGGFCINSTRRLTLGELLGAASFAQADFFAFNFTRIAGYVAMQRTEPASELRRSRSERG